MDHLEFGNFKLRTEADSVAAKYSYRKDNQYSFADSDQNTYDFCASN